MQPSVFELAFPHLHREVGVHCNLSPHSVDLFVLVQLSVHHGFHSWCLEFFLLDAYDHMEIQHSHVLLIVRFLVLPCHFEQVVFDESVKSQRSLFGLEVYHLLDAESDVVSVLLWQVEVVVAESFPLLKGWRLIQY